MARTTLSLIAAAWLLAATQVNAGPIAAAEEPAATNSELASLGGLLQALGAGVIGNGALLYPTAQSSHQRAENEILASDTATRVLKKVKSILKDGGINDDENGDDESKSVTYLVKPALIFHKEELPPPNPLAGNVLPLPGGALMYTPSPTAAPNSDPTSGPAASIKAAYGNLFAASPYTPSYTLNKPHAAVVVEEVTDLISLKSSLQRLEEAGEDVDDDDSDDEDNFGRKKKYKKPIKFETLEFVESSSTFVNPFTRADFPFGLMTPQPTTTASSSSKSSSHKTITKTVSAKSSSASDQLKASLGKDGGITVVNNGASPSPTTTQQGTTIVIPASSLQAQSSAASSSSPAPAPESSQSSSASPQESKNEDLSANEVTRLAHMHKSSSSANPDASKATSVKGIRRDAAIFDPLGEAVSATEAAVSSSQSLLRSTNIEALVQQSKESASPSVTAGSSTASVDVLAEGTTSALAQTASASTEAHKHRKMRIVKVYEVKKNKSAATGTEVVSVATTKSVEIHKRDVLPVYNEEPVYAANAYARETGVGVAGVDVPHYRNMYPVAASNAHDRVENVQRIYKDRDEIDDNEDDSDNEDAESDKPEEVKSSNQSSSSASAASSSSSGAAEEKTAAEDDVVVETTVVENTTSPLSTASPASSASSASAESSESVSAKGESTSLAASSSATAVVAATTTVESSTTEVVKADSTSVESSKVSAESTTVASAKSAETSASTSAKKSELKSMSIETIDTNGEALLTTATPAGASDTAAAATATAAAASSTSVEGKSEASSSAEKKKGKGDSDSDDDSDSDSDSDSDDENASEKDNDDKDDSDEESDDDKDSDNEGGSGRRKGGRSKARVAVKAMDINNKEDSLRALNRLAAFGMREAEKAVLDFEMHSEADQGVEILTTTDKAALGTEEALATSTAEVDPLAISAAPDFSTSPNLVRAAANKNADEESDEESDDEENNNGNKKDSKSSGTESDDEENNDDSDDSDNESSSDAAPKSDSVDIANTTVNSDSVDIASTTAKSENVSTASQLSSSKSQAVARTASEEEAESRSARKALEEALIESSRQAIELSLTEVETAVEGADDASDGVSGFARGFASDQEASDELESDLDLVTNASDDDYEYETNSGVNSDGEAVEFVTQLVPVDSKRKADMRESPSIVVMESIDEEYEEDDVSETRKPATTTGFGIKAARSTGVAAVERDAPLAAGSVHDAADIEEPIVRGVEPIPDVSIIKESQNRAMNIGMGNLRRHI
ncbi:hypothetical protein LPJ72_003625 [Coemansia sp. Benny D160-2]|nr:hypothetical protein LPJ72_003625 [Coemansia sp. Benny D160-2]